MFKKAVSVKVYPNLKFFNCSCFTGKCNKSLRILLKLMMLFHPLKGPNENKLFSSGLFYAILVILVPFL